MRLSGITMVRDEADVIEAWARHNLHFLDRLYVVDDGSTDATGAILSLLRQEGLAVELVDIRDRQSYYQGRSTTALLGHALSRETWDFVFPLDGDEFIVADDRAALEASLSAIPQPRIPGLSPIQYFPDAEDASADPDPVARIQHAAEHDPYVFKIAVPGELGTQEGIRITDGNHTAFLNDVLLPVTLLSGVHLAHFPVRSREQLVAKCLAGYMRRRSRADYNESISLLPVRAARLLGEERRLDVDTFDTLLATYEPLAAAPRQLRPFQRQGGPLVYTDLAVTYPFRRILSAADDLVEGARATAQESLELRRDLERRGTTAARRFFTRQRRSLLKRLTRLRTRQEATEA